MLPTHYKIRLRLFLALFNRGNNRYPYRLNELLTSFELRGPHDYKLAIWDSPDELILGYIQPATKDELKFFLTWQSVYVSMQDSLKPEFKTLTLEFLMTQPTESKLPEEYLSKLNGEIASLEFALNQRIPDFGIQLQSVLGRLQELPEAAWALPDDQLKVIAEAFKANRNVVAFAATTKPKSPKGPVTADML